MPTSEATSVVYWTFRAQIGNALSPEFGAFSSRPIQMRQLRWLKRYGDERRPNGRRKST